MLHEWLPKCWKSIEYDYLNEGLNTTLNEIRKIREVKKKIEPKFFLRFEVYKTSKILIKTSSVIENIELDIQNTEVTKIDDPIIY